MVNHACGKIYPLMRTPLYRIHKELSARFTRFSGWEMPLHYGSLIAEVKAVRESAGLFDVSHMGRFLLSGKDAFGVLQKLTTADLSKLKPGRVRYTLFTNERGGVKDDATVYMLAEDRFLLCVNAANRDKMREWIGRFLPVRDLSEETVQIALQGRDSERILSRLYRVSDLSRYAFREFDEVLISRTGYTGEDGFEIYAPADTGVELFRELVENARPCGLGARDVLRIEAGLPLYGHEISEDITPFEANLDRFVDTSKEFIGREALLSRKPERRLFGLELAVRGVPREGYELLKGNRQIGYVTSGTFSPTLRKGIALCFVDTEERREGNRVLLRVRDRLVEALLRSYPFVAKQQGKPASPRLS